MDTHRAHRILVVSVPMVILVCIRLASGAPAPSEPFPAQFSFISAQIEQARSRINSISYHALDESDDVFPELGSRHVVCRWDVLERGSLRAITRNWSITFADGRTPPQKNTTRAIVGASYFGLRWNENHAGDQYLYASLDSMSQRASGEVRGFAGLSIMAYGLGDGDWPFSVPYIHNPAYSRWEVSEIRGPAGENVFQMKRFQVQPARTTPESVWVVDPQQGWLITRVTRFGADGEVASELNVQPAEVQKGFFLPARAERSIHRHAPGADVRVDKSVINFTNIELNPTIRDNQFTLAYLGLPEGSMIQQYQLDGAVIPMAYAHGQAWEPKVATEFMAQDKLRHLDSVATPPVPHQATTEDSTETHASPKPAPPPPVVADATASSGGPRLLIGCAVVLCTLVAVAAVLRRRGRKNA